MKSQLIINTKPASADVEVEANVIPSSLQNGSIMTGLLHDKTHGRWFKLSAARLENAIASEDSWELCVHSVGSNMHGFFRVPIQPDMQVSQSGLSVVIQKSYVGFIPSTNYMQFGDAVENVNGLILQSMQSSEWIYAPQPDVVHQTLYAYGGGSFIKRDIVGPSGLYPLYDMEAGEDPKLFLNGYPLLTHWEGPSVPGRDQQLLVHYNGLPGGSLMYRSNAAEERNAWYGIITDSFPALLPLVYANNQLTAGLTFTIQIEAKKGGDVDEVEVFTSTLSTVTLPDDWGDQLKAYLVIPFLENVWDANIYRPLYTDRYALYMHNT